MYVSRGGQGMAPSSEPHEAQFADQNDDYVRTGMPQAQSLIIFYLGLIFTP